MQDYYYMKLKGVVIQLCTAFTLIIFALCIAASIVQEMLGSYRSSSRYAYIAGLVICAVLICAGIMLIFFARHFENRCFEKKGADFELFKTDIGTAGCVRAGNLILSNSFLIVFDYTSPVICHAIRTDKLTAFFEKGRWENIEGESDYSVNISDSRFNTYTFKPAPDDTVRAHELKESICRRMPWIFTENEEKFMGLKASARGRRRLTTLIKSRREDVLAAQKSPSSVMQEESAASVTESDKTSRDS